MGTREGWRCAYASMHVPEIEHPKKSNSGTSSEVQGMIKRLALELPYQYI